MGAPMPDMEPVENASAEALLSSLKTIDPAERRKHASVFNYWLSIRANRQFPPIRDLDPLEISDAGPWSVLLEMIGGGDDAIIRHFGQAIRDGVEIEKVADAASGSLLSRIHAKLPLVAACREAFAFEDSCDSSEGSQRCWVTLLPFSATGTWIDYVYGYVSLESSAEAESEPEAVKASVEAGELAEVPVEEVPAESAEVTAEAVEPETPTEDLEGEAPEPFKVELRALDEDSDSEPEAAPVEMAPEPEPEPVVPPVAEKDFETAPEVDEETASDSRPSFTAKVMESLASVGGFYGKVVQTGPQMPADAFAAEAAETAIEEEAIEPEAEPQAETISEPASHLEGPLHSKLSEVRALAEEAREAQVRSNVALYEGLSAAYDFALEAENEPEEYLRLVEAQGLKIQLRSPMQPVVKLAFDGMCDEPTIKQLEAVLAWALKQDLPKGTLAERIQAEGGIGALLNGQG